MTFHIAQVNIARMRAPLEEPVMAGFVARLGEINALADRSLLVRETVEQLKDYVYRTAHAELLKQRRDWFEQFDGAQIAMWWVPAGHIPGIDEAKKRLAHLEEHGSSQFAFTFRTIHPPDETFLSSFDWSVFRPCPAT